MSKIILYELNEVPLRILDYYRSMRPNSWFNKNYSKFRKFESYSENGGHLSPWNTWPTLHRGVSNEKHYISDFNQNLGLVDKDFPPIWKILADNNVKTGVFGSLHSYPLPEDLSGYSFYIPDVFAAGSECFPKDYELFQEINLRLSRKSARNVDSSIPYKDALKLMAKAGKMGFKFSTVMDVGKQLTDERINRWKTVRRRTYQTVLGFDVFYKLLVKEKPDFVTFFTNHVASSQHRYWAALFPDDYENLKYDQEWINTYSNEILWTMDKTDQMLSRLSKFVAANPDYKLVITSSMGQNAIECEPIETQLYITDHKKFFETLEIDANDFEFLPSMLPQFNYSVKNSEKFKSKLDSLTVNGKNVSYRELGESRFSLDLGHQNLKSTEIILDGKAYSPEDIGMENMIIEDKSAATAYHIPEGHFFIYHPSHDFDDKIEAQIPTCEIMPTFLQNFAVDIPDYSKKPSGSILN